ncbi:MAG: cupin domain-containing protein [Gemmatimonadetes bacterium]|nr:cupin domain-containing protein [Gemmatimonadota bacterium]MYG16683.1 cupin domain-containing protein [Gemmatimonadota bacterium]
MLRHTCKRITPAEVAAKIPAPNGDRFHVALERGELQIELYIPRGTDDQKPHSRDECYVIVEGNGKFEMGGEVVPFEAGDFFFVPAKVEHRFLDFGESMTTWVIFYGPEGGEQI